MVITRSGRRALVIRRSGAILVMAALLVVAILASLAFGSDRLSLGAVIAGTPADNAVVWGSRVPRTAIGLMVGAGLGVAGTVMQGQTRNPLADPGLFGVSSGAALAVVLGVYIFGVNDAEATVWFALAGALIASVAVFSVTAVGGAAASPVPLALAGTAVSALLDAFTSFVVLADRNSLNAYRLWVVGSLSGRQLHVVAVVWPVMAAGLILAIANVRSLDARALGDDMARGLGENVFLARAVGLGSITLLTAGAVAAAGPIGFVGLTVPHAARAVVGSGHRWTIPAAALIGAILVLVADVVGRLIAGQSEIEVGIVLALIGGPIFVAIARRRSLAAL
jgi:iron complex transport system permease protein